jgi:hypothetical protein
MSKLTNSDPAQERVGVRTYVPTYQRDIWRENADEMGMSLSEFVRVMVQAGQSDFDFPDPETGVTTTPEKSRSPDATPGGEGLEEGVVELLRSDGPLDWDELVDGLAGDFEGRLESTLNNLQSANVVKHSGREGGYVMDDGR